MRTLESDKVKQQIMAYGFNERNFMAVVTEGLNQADVLGLTKGRRAIEFEIKVSRADLQKELAALRYAQLDDHKETIKLNDGSPEQTALFAEMAALKKKSGGWSKISKHEEYIDPVAYFERMSRRHYYHNGYVPNVFYLVVPDKLVPLAIEGVKGTKYGVIAYDGCRGGHYGYKLGDQWFDRDDESRPDGARWTSGRPCAFDTSLCRPEVAVKKPAREIHKNPVSDMVVDAMLQRACRENITMLSEILSTSQWLVAEREENARLKAELEQKRL